MTDITSAFGSKDKDKWFERFFRFGLISKGIVYLLVGGLAVFTAIGLAEKQASKEDVLNFIYEQPLGNVFLMIVAVGLAGYATLRFFQAFKDIDNKGDDARGIMNRIGYGISGLIYLSLSVYALKVGFDISSGGGDSRQLIVGKVLQFSWGAWVVGIVGVITIGSGIYQIFRAATGKFMKKIRLVTPDIMSYVKKAGMVGYSARGIVLIIIGYLVTHAAITSNAREASGTEGAFAFIENRFGSFLMVIIAIGLVAYGIFMFVKAKYQRISL